MGVPPISRESVDDSTRVQQLTGDARTPPSRLTIIQKDSAIAIADDQGHARTFRPDGHLEELTIGTVPLPTTARWDGASLVVVYDVETGRQLRYTYTPSADPTRLQVNIRFLERGREGDEVRLTYEPPGAHERAILSGAPASPAAPSASASTPPGVPDAAPPSARPPVLPPGSELRGLTTIGTVVEDLSAQGKACGLDQEKIKTSIARILADAGFKTERFGNEETYVMLSVVTSRLPDGTVRVAIRRIARDAGRRDVSVPEGSCRSASAAPARRRDGRRLAGLARVGRHGRARQIGEPLRLADSRGCRSYALILLFKPRRRLKQRRCPCRVGGKKRSSRRRFEPERAEPGRGLRRSGEQESNPHAQVPWRQVSALRPSQGLPGATIRTHRELEACPVCRGEP